MPKSLALETESILREFAFTFPEVTEDFPWGHRALKVKGKTFVWLVADEALSMTVKLPESNGVALVLPFAKPAEYGLGKSGWISAQFPPNQTPPLDMLKSWIEESYRAVAPKKLVALLDAGESAPAPKKKAPAKKAAVKAGTKTTPKKTAAKKVTKAPAKKSTKSK